MPDLTKKVWWNYLNRDLQELLLTSLDLYRVSHSFLNYHDYSFVVFPASKAYEGFLKLFFRDMGFITEEEYLGTRFRIGKALNPSLEERLRGSEWVYGKLIKYCQGEKLPRQLWDTWRDCRNQIFHWFPNEFRALTREEARDKVFQIIDALDLVFSECDVPVYKHEKGTNN